MKVAWLLATCAVLTLPAHAETIAGLSLGAREAQVAAAFPGERFYSTNIEGQQVVYTKYYAATLCRGRLVGIQQNVGSGLHNYTAAVEVETLRRGAPKTIVTHTPTPDGPSSLISTVWFNREGEAFAVNGFQHAEGALSVAKHLTDPDGMLCAAPSR